MMTREYPPEIYGGAGVHVTELVTCLRALCTVDVHCMGAERESATAHHPDPALGGANLALTTLSADLSMANSAAGVDIVHSHTWYTGMAGHLSALLHDVPHIATAHSLEPRRPWKAQQLGGGYRVSSWVERTAMENADAIIAVSNGMRTDVLDTYPSIDPARVHVVHNGIDTAVWHPGDLAPGHQSVLDKIGVDRTRPIVAFVGRITQQKGVRHLIAAAHRFAPDAQLVLCAGAPDTPEIAAQTRAAVDQLQAARSGVFWVQEMLPTEAVREVLAAATVFVCPSVYEPLGIVNLEAMACGTAVVASNVGGIPEVVDKDHTGALVPYDSRAPRAFEADIAAGVNAVLADPQRAAEMGRAGRERAIAKFSWAQIAERTLDVYQQVSAGRL